MKAVRTALMAVQRGHFDLRKPVKRLRGSDRTAESIIETGELKDSAGSVRLKFASKGADFIKTSLRRSERDAESARIAEADL